METISIHDKKFRISIDSEKIQSVVEEMARKMNAELMAKDVVFVVILNGAFMFASDLLKRINFNCNISFLKLTSYKGMVGNGLTKQLIGLNEDLKNKTIVVLEDIVDTGNTLKYAISRLNELNPGEIKVATLLFKPGSYLQNLPLDYLGFKIPDDFVIGYGLDYDGYGRNYTSIYSVIDP